MGVIRLCGALSAFALCGQAAVLQGVVLDFESGHALARTVVVLTPVQTGGGLTPQTVRTESNGTFWFGAPPGVYTLMLGREGFATYRYGARCWNCAGAPLFLNGEERTALDVRMHRLGAISGTILDENQVGIPEIPLIVYSATRPLQQAGKTKTDDRGFFRVGNLPPGAYVVRTVATQTRDGMSYLASFYPEGTDMKLSRTIGVELERTASNIDFPAVPGKLYRVQGRVVSPTPGMASSVDLISDSGREKAPVDGQGNFVFDHVPPGNYELFADGRTSGMYYAAWQPVLVEHDTDVNAQMTPCYGVNLSVTNEQRRQMLTNEMKVTLHRRDLDRDGPDLMVRPPRSPDVAPGNWAIEVTAGTNTWVRDITVNGKRAESRSKDSADGWNLTRLSDGMNRVQINTVSPTGSITGRVVDKPNETAPYVPVFLETLSLEPPDPPVVRETRTAADGSYQFQGLPPGKYRLLSSFDLDPSDRVALEAAHPAEVSLSEGGSAVRDLMLYHKP